MRLGRVVGSLALALATACGGSAPETRRSGGTDADGGRATSDGVEEPSGVAEVAKRPNAAEGDGATVCIEPPPGAPRTLGRRKAPEAVLPASDSWLLAHQSADGGWSAADFGRWCEGASRDDVASDGAGVADRDVGSTALALLSFLASGYTNRSDGPVGKAVGNGFRRLRSAQDADGCFAPRTSDRFLYDHALATLLALELYGMTASPIAKGPAQRALDFLAASRSADGDWKRRDGASDPVLTGWAMLAFSTARLVADHDVQVGRAPSLTLDAQVFPDLRRWVDRETDPATGRIRSPSRPAAATAVGAFARVLLGEDPERSDAIGKAVAACLDRLPRWSVEDGSIDLEYWFFATALMADVGGDAWTAWSMALDRALIESQRRDGDRCGVAGSWDPSGPGAVEGGRVWSTALAIQCQQLGHGYVLRSGFLPPR